MTESPIFGITSSDAQAAVRAIIPSEDVNMLVHKRIATLCSEQPALYMTLDGIGNTLLVQRRSVYDLGISLTYPMIPAPIRQDPLSVHNLNVVTATLQESPSEKESVEYDLSWFVENLRSDSPGYALWLDSIVSSVDDPDIFSDLSFGSLLTLLPFYLREEARRMEKMFFG